jgi:hypothetical protein
VEAIKVEPEKILPGIHLDRINGVFQIYGTSCPQDAVEFYEPIFNWLDKYLENPLESTTLDFKLEYFNTVSAKVFLKIMGKMEDLSESGYNAKIRWFYTDGDDDLIEAGEEFADIIDVRFEYVRMENEYDDEEISDEFMDDIF